MQLQLHALALVALAGETLSLPVTAQSVEPLNGLKFSLAAQKVHFSNDSVPAKTLKDRSGIVASVVPSPTSSLDFGYLVPIQVGSQSFNIKVDTGSEAFWLLSNQLPATMTGTGHTIYTPGPSASQISGETFDSGYDDNSGGEGVVYADHVVLGGATVTSQALGAATSVAPIQNGPNSGMLGLDYSPVQYGFSPTKPATFMANLKSQLASPVFTVDLHKDATGYIDFGFVDTTKYQAPLTYVPRLTTSTNLWLIAPGTYSIGNTVSSGSLATTAVADTGTSKIIVPQPVVDQYYTQVPGVVNTGSNYIFPCANLGSNLMPSFGVNLGGETYTVPGDYMWSQHYNSTYCYGALEGTAGTAAVLGDMFLRTQFVVYDYTGTGRVGFAPKATLQPAPTP
ncbi:Type I transmembrane sorting receptor [Xylographa bjoerkii]|nr:Type I transmembrane sorting receptor [Xylographa bjoerkii]